MSILLVSVALYALIGASLAALVLVVAKTPPPSPVPLAVVLIVLCWPWLVVKLLGTKKAKRTTHCRGDTDDSRKTFQ